jgi:hypothetical protein
MRVLVTILHTLRIPEINVFYLPFEEDCLLKFNHRDKEVSVTLETLILSFLKSKENERNIEEVKVV